jgi:hypothetical protein
VSWCWMLQPIKLATSWSIVTYNSKHAINCEYALFGSPSLVA